MANIVLDANVIVGWLDKYDSLGDRASKVVGDILAAGDILILLDFVIAESVSVICRRASERKKNVPDLSAILDRVNRWYQDNAIEFVQRHLAEIYPDDLDVIRQSAGALNFNDATLVALQRRDLIGEVATFDVTLASQPGFRTFG